MPPGIEPGTQGFSVLCSTNWAMAPSFFLCRDYFSIDLFSRLRCKVRKIFWNYQMFWELFYRLYFNFYSNRLSITDIWCEIFFIFVDLKSLGHHRNSSVSIMTQINLLNFPRILFAKISLALVYIKHVCKTNTCLIYSHICKTSPKLVY